MEKYVFIHRDGVICVRQDQPLAKPDDFIFLPFVFEAFREFELNGFKPVVLVWEEGLQNGALSAEDHAVIIEQMKEGISEHEGKVHDVIACPGPMAPWDKCALPKGGMLQIACAKYQLNPQSVYFISDRFECLEAGWAAGCKNILVRSGKPYQTMQKLRKSEKQPYKIERDILSASLRIINELDTARMAN